VDRVIIGTAPEKESGTSDTYHRAGNTGVFISKPGANVLSCSDGDLLFDSTTYEFLSVLTKGRATVAKAESKTQAKDTIVNTFEPFPSANDDPVFVLWNVILPASFSTSMGQSITNAPFLSMDMTALGAPQKTGFVPGTSLTSITRANTDNYPASANTIDVVFKNGSPHNDIEVQWTLFRESGAS
jgi:hypothetical protein